MRDELASKDRLINQMNDIHLKGIEEMDLLRAKLEDARAIANLKAELQEKDRKLSEASQQPSVNSEPSTVEPEPTPEPEPITEIPVIDPELIPQTEVVDAAGLMKYILKEFPDANVEYKKIKDSIRDRHKPAKSEKISRLACYERDYNFKYFGKNGNDHQYEIPKKS